METKIPLHIYVTDKKEVGATTKYSELPSTNMRTVIISEEKVKQVMEDHDLSDYRDIVDFLKNEVDNILNK